MAQPGGVTPQPPHDGHGEEVPIDTEGPELVTAAQGGQDGLKVGFCESTQIEVQVLEGGCHLL